MKRPKYKDKEIKSGEIDFNEVTNSVIKEINILRSDPHKYVELLERDKSYMKDSILYRPEEDPLKTQEGESAYDEAIEVLLNQELLNELNKDTDLCRACEDHCKDIGELGLFTQNGSNGETVVHRVEAYIEWDNILCQCIEFGSITAQEIVMSLITCDGDPSRVNRKNLLRNDISFIGVSSAHHKNCEILTVVMFAGEIREKCVQSTFIQEYRVPELNTKTELQGEDLDAPNQALTSLQIECEKEIEAKLCKYIQKVYTMKDGTNHIIEIYEG